METYCNHVVILYVTLIYQQNIQVFANKISRYYISEFFLENIFEFDRMSKIQNILNIFSYTSDELTDVPYVLEL